MLKFNEFQQLDEKQVIVGGGKRYGQIVFLAGGAGSGKGFAKTQFMEGDKFKSIDVDEWKKAFQKIAAVQNKYQEIQNLDLRKPDDVFALHKFVDELGLKDKFMKTLLKDLQNPKTLPNIMFDVTLKNTKYMNTVIPMLMAVGYMPENIHLTWILSKYSVAVRQNAQRSRVVPDDILLQTHEGAATTMWDILGGKIPANLNGSVHVILGGKNNTIFWKDDQGKMIYAKKKAINPKTGRTITLKSPVIKSFKYIQAKKQGKPMDMTKDLKRELFQWILKNVPKTEMTRFMWKDVRLAKRAGML